MAFRFTLQAVLDHRRTQEEQVQRAYGQAQSQVEAARRERRQVQQDMAMRMEEVHRRQPGEAGFSWRALYENWIEELRRQARRIEQEIVTLEEHAEQWRAKLVKAMQARMIMEKLREKELRAYRLEQARAERRLFDEIAARNYITRQEREKHAAHGERIAS